MGLDVAAIAKLVTGYFTGESDIVLTPYDFNDTKVLLGVPPTPLIGLDYISVRHTNRKAKRFQCLTGSATFCSNVCTAGVIELGMLSGSLSQGHIQINDFTGIPFPILILDKSSGGTSTVAGTGCQLIETPEWRRDAVPGLTIWTFEADRLLVSHGIHLPEVSQ
jgi:hypothetical protein